MRRTWILLGTLVFLFALAAGMLIASKDRGQVVDARAAPARAGNATSAGDPAAPPHSALVDVMTAHLTAVPQWVETPGAAKAEFESQVAARVTARVARILVREGDAVTRGQVLAVLDSRDLDASLKQAEEAARAAAAGYSKARTAASMEVEMSGARIQQARAAVQQNQAALRVASAHLDLVLAGPRRQEREQAAQAVAQARANLTLANSNLQKTASLFDQGAVSRQYYETILSQAQVARAQLASAQEAQSLVEEGSRPEDITGARDAVQGARAALAQSQASLQQAEASAQQVSVRRQEVQAAAAQVGQMNAALQFAQVTRGFAAVTAPFDGVVSARLVDPGAIASPGSPLLKVQGGQVRMEAAVSEDDVQRLRPGGDVSVILDALRNRRITARIVEIAPQGDPSSHTFLVKANLPPESGARAGMFGRVLIPTGLERLLLVPAAAVWELQGLHYLFVVDGTNVAHLRMVTIGDPVGDQITVLSGLSPGERVVAEHPDRVSDGERVIASPPVISGPQVASRSREAPGRSG